jgi:cytochrome oxidase Cu insertion factor (SCO1/SenC/PrrC family)
MDSNKLKLTALLLMAALPIGLATWYFGAIVNQASFSTTNKGRLVQPVLDVTALQLRESSGAPAYLPFEELVAGISPEDYKPRPWQLLYLGAPECDALCVDRLYFLRQLHTRLGREADRVERVYVQVAAMPGPLPEATASILAEQHPDMKQLHAESSSLQQVLAPTVPAGEDAIGNHYIYVVDPVGNVMLYFTPDNTPEEILSDLDKLLDQSSLG